MKLKFYFSILLLTFLFDLPEANAGGGNEPASQYTVGNFLVRISKQGSLTPQFSIVNKNEPGRILIQTLEGVSLVGGAFATGNIVMHGVPQGSFKVNDTIVASYDGQSIDRVQADAKGLTISGQLKGNGGQTGYRLIFTLASANQLQFRVTLAGGGTQRANRIFLRYLSSKEEHFYGFGEQLTFFDQKKNLIPIMVQEHGIGRGLPFFTQLVDKAFDGGGGNPYVTTCPAPHYISSKLNSLFLENKEYCEFDLRRDDRVSIKMFADSLTGRIIYGKTPLDLIQEYTGYTGRMRALPDWVNNGAIVSLQRGTAELRRRVTQLDSAGVPLAALWVQDWCGGRQTSVGSQLYWNWILSDSAYPGWRPFVDSLNARNVKMMTYINPFLTNAPGHDSLFRIAEKNGFLVKNKKDSVYLIRNSDFYVGLTDLSNPAAYQWMKGLITDNLIKNAKSSGWMADFAEALPYDAVLYKNAPTSYWHNHYTEMWAQVNREAINDAPGSADMLFFNRSGFTKSPGNSTLLWLGDQMQTWDQFDGIKTAVVGMLSAGMSGFSFAHSDIGGYNAFADTLKGIAFKIARGKELLMRWEELGIFNPVFRTHEGINPPLSVQYYTDNETMAHFVRSAKMFKALSFYRKQLVREAADKGYPVVRHPFLEFSDDRNTFDLRYQFMYGTEFMVAPVLDPILQVVRIYLPKGTWVNLWTGEQVSHATGKWLIASAPIGKPAIFYPKGSKVGERYVQELKALGVIPPDQSSTPSIESPWKATIYPNPVKDLLTVTFTGSIKTLPAYTLTSVTGKVISTGKLSGTQTKIPMASFPAGLYFLKIYTTEKNISYPILKL